MKHRLIVIDQNCLGRREVIDPAYDKCVSQDLHLCIAGASAMELSKCLTQGHDPIGKWKQSLAAIAPFSDRVVVGRKLAALCSEEVATGYPCARLDDESTNGFFREILQDLANGDDGGIRVLTSEKSRTMLQRSLVAWQKPVEFRDNAMKLMQTLSQQLGSNGLKRLRKSPEVEIDNWMVSRDGLRHVYQLIRVHTKSDLDALRLTFSPSALAGFTSGPAALALLWLGRGGFETADAEQSRNDLLDIEYAIVGALSHSLLTRDKRLKTVHEAIRKGFQNRLTLFGLNPYFAI